MFSEFTKPFSLHFVVGFFLPVVLLFVVLSVVTGVVAPTDALTVWIAIQGIGILSGISLVLLAAWFIALILLVTNMQVISLLAGTYLAGVKPLLVLERRRFRRLQGKLAKAKTKYRQERDAGRVLPATEAEYTWLLTYRHRSFPPEDEDLWPTQFGNVIQAFEFYSCKMYGLNALPAWPRIIPLVPEDHREMINQDKSYVDFAVNLLVLMVLAIMGYCAYAAVTGHAPIWWILIVLSLIAWGSYRMAVGAAFEWGDAVKAVFDLYRGELLQRLGIPAPGDAAEEKALWIRMSQAFSYWQPVEWRRAQSEPASSKPGGDPVKD